MSRETQIARQVISGNKWARANGLGTVEAFTGFGKTWIANYIIQRMKTNMGEFPVVVIVPTHDLQSQWEEKFIEWGIDGTAHVINGIVIKELFVRAKLVIYDEIHLYVNGALFNTIFALSRYVTYQLGLTATLTEDYRRRLIAYGLPVVDIITLEEGKRNGWVADYTQYNFGIDISPADRNIYNGFQNKFESYFATFDYDWPAMIGCLKAEDDTKKDDQGRVVVIHQGARNYCIANNIPLTKMKEVMRNASQAMRCNNDYRNFLYNHPSKLIATREIVELFDVKTITFGISTESADKLVDLLPGSVACHANVTGKDVPRELLYKYGYEKTGGAAWKYIGKDRLNELHVKMFKAGEIKVVHSAKKLIQGLDVPELQLLVMHSFDSSAIKEIQSIGRVIRKEKVNNINKKASIFKLFINGTKDEDWLEKSQKTMKGIRTIYSLDEI